MSLKRLSLQLTTFKISKFTSPSPFSQSNPIHHAQNRYIRTVPSKPLSTPPSILAKPNSLTPSNPFPPARFTNTISSFSTLATTMSTTYKLVWYAPESDLERTKDAVFGAGAGGIGNYEKCAWQVKGIGQFKPVEGANPTIGGVGELEKLEEWRVEVIVPQENARKVIKALVEAHSYEEPAYELIKMASMEELP